MTRASRSSLAWGRETIVSLTQAEIMLVLAVVLLLLLLVKNEDLAAAKDDLREAEERTSALAEQGAMSEEAIVEQREQAELAREVKEMLVRRESAPPAETGTARLQPRDREANLLRSEDVEELRRVVEETVLVNRAIERLERETESVNGAPPRPPRQERVKQLGDAVAIAGALDAHLSPERQDALRSALERDNANLMPRSEQGARATSGGEAVGELLSQWLGDTAATNGRSDGGRGDQVGFDPCWPRPARRNERRYYVAYDVTYANGRYAVKPHSDWQAGVPVVDEALAGPVSALRDYPRTSVSPDELLKLGQRIDAAVDGLRKSRAYPPKCLLVATINEEASGAVAKFIRHKVGIYPITR